MKDNLPKVSLSLYLRRPEATKTLIYPPADSRAKPNFTFSLSPVNINAKKVDLNGFASVLRTNIASEEHQSTALNRKCLYWYRYMNKWQKLGKILYKPYIKPRLWCANRDMYGYITPLRRYYFWPAPNVIVPCIGCDLRRASFYSACWREHDWKVENIIQLSLVMSEWI
jgi:hypothetical protein